MNARRMWADACSVKVPDKTRREILREHEQLKNRIREETGCDAFDAHLRAWARLFAYECDGMPGSL
ncbi:MAG: hypothetical protein RDU20_22915 [Desulfomonilaceae bacterium]|nr:hypothetical protein [Desulfomonilaceae bacterium]